MRKLLAIIVLCLILSPAFAGTKGKKLIEYGWDVPDTLYMREHVREMEKVPFDGVVIRVSRRGAGGNWGIGWETFSKKKFELKDYDYAIEDLKATKFKKFTDNFIQVISAPGDVDWLDPEWSAVAHNAACLAKVAKEGGCVGIMFDPELYVEHQVWTYNFWKKTTGTTLTFDEYAAKVRERGREFIRAINKEFPNVVILCLYGDSLPWVESQLWTRKPLSENGYGLLPAFYDGILDAATPQTVLVDGFEFSYGYRTRKEFVNGRKLALNDAKKLSMNPREFKNHVRMGYGVWADWDSNRVGWHPDDFSKNYWTPAGLRASLNYALDLSDRYVWVYSERFSWWPWAAPKEYMDALRLAKEGPGPGEPYPLDLSKIYLTAANQPGYSDEATFSEMRKTMTEVFDFPKDGWRFMRDEQNAGVKQGWYRLDFNDAAWRAISIGKFWEEQTGYYDGRAWYRTKFTAPNIEPGKRVFLAVGAADESAKVWLNGKFIGERDIGWDKPFALEVTHTLKSGQENLLAVQVLDRVAVGGLWKSVKLMVR